ncbi:unnamed protein product [Aphanomyces euteiches]|uniref:subtilisin n=1 Tax=Aphanomyces euteiches TaxID=100861 RepID=A0A6G0WKW9_9STRA|nr:hypothetical protein Ae201684_014163 [Aphanomyces euteiches]KAH9096305.1 hypothetical protein Ae201684P_009537 [Aphanomyces euteiches]
MLTKLAWIAAIVTALTSAKIASNVLLQLEADSVADIVIEFSSNKEALESADVGIESIQTRGGQIAHIQQSLANHALTSQRSAKEVLQSQPEESAFTFKSFFISNTLHVSGATKDIISQLAKLPEVTNIRKPYVAKLPVVTISNTNSSSISATNEWGVNLIKAPAVWASGNKGEGIVVGGIDTGVLYTHEALKGNWRSNYGWYDPTKKTATPSDGNGHGTHTMGTSVGQNGIGVAPGATWISCQGCTTDQCTEDSLLACGQWMLCPTDTQGNNPKCDLAPNVINNSWGGSSAGETWYQATVDAWQKAGIIPVFANGNAGPNCATVASPGDHKNVIGVGAVASTDKLASFSSRGPTPDKRIKPDVSAPGQNVRSSWNTGNSAYNTISGTSMATPHVTGAVALYLASHKGAAYSDVLKAFTSTVDTATLTPNGANCGSVSDSKYPNNNYGYGRINVANAAGVSPSPSTSSPSATTSKPTPAATTSKPTPAASTTKPTPAATTSKPTRAPTTSTKPTTRAPPAVCGTCSFCYYPDGDNCLTDFTKSDCTYYSAAYGTVWCGN